MSYRTELPWTGIGRFIERFIIYIICVVAGFGIGLFYTRDSFVNGANWMHTMYTKPGMVERTVINPTRLPEVKGKTPPESRRNLAALEKK